MTMPPALRDLLMEASYESQYLRDRAKTITPTLTVSDVERLVMLALKSLDTTSADTLMAELAERDDKLCKLHESLVQIQELALGYDGDADVVAEEDVRESVQKAVRAFEKIEKCVWEALNDVYDE